LVTQVNKIKSTLNIIIIKVLLRFTNKSKFQIGVNKFVIKRWNARGIHHFVWKPIPYINYYNRKIIGIYSRIWYNNLTTSRKRCRPLLSLRTGIALMSDSGVRSDFKAVWLHLSLFRHQTWSFPRAGSRLLVTSGLISSHLVRLSSYRCCEANRQIWTYPIMIFSHRKLVVIVHWPANPYCSRNVLMIDAIVINVTQRENNVKVIIISYIAVSRVNNDR